MRARAYNKRGDGLGQPYSGQPYPIPQVVRIDPRLEIALATLSAALKPTDPGADQSIQIIRDIIVAPGTGSNPAPGQPPRTAKLSDVSPLLSTLRDIRYSPAQSWIVENPMISAIVLLGGAFFLGNMFGKKGK